MPDRRTLTLIAGLVVLALLAAAVPACVRQWTSQRAQARTDASQTEAAQTSAADAINAVATAGGREAASENLTRQNARDIANAEGADVRVGAGVNLAGRKALCRRAAYRDDPKCSVFTKGTK